ncbi:class I SAM-dependent methyltransferase [Kiloniella sp.]|uniref:class I SAM-dependent methyltransferase n=1 Tax=Kiloniella sp. TaxID=1938587 RepID=UPI003B023A6E
MSRLDSFIRRVSAQRDILNYVTGEISDVDGPVLELGLGNGRTYDHLRENLPLREIFVFDRSINANPQSVADGDYMILGEIRDTLAFCGPRVKAEAALIHCDLGSGDPTTDLATCAWISPLIIERTAQGGIVASGLALDLPNFEELSLPEGIQKKRYFLYRKL